MTIGGEMMDEKRILSNVEGKLIKEDNKLIQATASMNPSSQKLFEIAVAAIDPKSEDANTVRIDKELIFKSLEINGKNRNNRLTDMLSKLVDDANFTYTEVVDGSNVDVKIKPVYQIKNNHKLAYSELSFAPDIMPLLVELHNRFTKYPLSDIVKMKSKYSIPLYRWLMLSFNQYEYYSTSNKRTQEQLTEYLNPKISLAELRRLTDTENKYKDWRNFRKRVLNTPMEEINSSSDRISFEWEAIRSGKNITDIKFTISKKFIGDQGEPEQAEDKYSEYVNSKYTIRLLNNGLLSPLDITNKSFMLTLGEELYPHYDAFVEEYSISKLEKHVQYLGKNKPGKVLKLDLYLKKSLDNYVLKLKEDAKPKVGQTRNGQKIKETVPDWENEKKVQHSAEEKEKLNKEIDARLAELYPEIYDQE